MNLQIIYRVYIYFICAIGLAFSLSSCQIGGSGQSTQNTPVNNSEPTSSVGPVIEFDTTSYDFGRVYEGESVGWYFKFKNKGDKNLILTNVTASCGCTTPEYSREPILSGAQGEIKVVFDSKGRSGHQYKSISVETNGKHEIIELSITADIVKK